MESFETDTHHELIKACLRNDRKAQQQLYQLYAKAMLNVGFRMLHSREDAEDVLQEAFTDAFRRLSSFRFESTFGAWLKRIVINRCINQLRKKKADLQFIDDMQLFANRPEDEYEPAELSIDSVKKAMQDLPSGSRIIFSLYLLEGYDHQEISEILNISVSNSKTQYMRAKHRVKELLIPQGNEI
ncbi:MAG: sigma-70 family RNA polymerase sigma factor [Bacteroidales bacterium]|nr:sigma-70 family RNA polymerase sigma factor [Bacteroidales bacterium]